MKEIVAKVFAERVSDGDCIGIGSGSTVELAVKAIGERIKSEGIKISGIPTSHYISLVAQESGIEILSAISRTKISWAFDGADEVDPQLNMIKGGGAAMLNEKIIAGRSERLVILVCLLYTSPSPRD